VVTFGVSGGASEWAVLMSALARPKACPRFTHLAHCLSWASLSRLADISGLVGWAHLDRLVIRPSSAVSCGVDVPVTLERHVRGRGSLDLETVRSTEEAWLAVRRPRLTDHYGYSGSRGVGGSPGGWVAGG
jgi:hypothetical protein